MSTQYAWLFMSLYQAQNKQISLRNYGKIDSHWTKNDLFQREKKEKDLGSG